MTEGVPLIALQAKEDARHWRTSWRLHYEYGPADPRYTCMTDEGILHDMLVLKERQDVKKDGSIDSWAEADPDGLADKLDEIKEMSDAVWKAAQRVESTIPEKKKLRIIIDGNR